MPINCYNVAPSTRVQLRRTLENVLHIDAVKWGWAPFWAKGKRLDPINARVKTVNTGTFFKQLWPSRGCQPTDDFEWYAVGKKVEA